MEMKRCLHVMNFEMKTVQAAEAAAAMKSSAASLKRRRTSSGCTYYFPVSLRRITEGSFERVHVPEIRHSLK